MRLTWKIMESQRATWKEEGVMLQCAVHAHLKISQCVRTAQRVVRRNRGGLRRSEGKRERETKEGTIKRDRRELRGVV